MAKMPTVMLEGSVEGRLRIIPHQPLYHFSSYNQHWTRILMMEDGCYLKVCLTPVNPTVLTEWAEIGDEQILWSSVSLFRASEKDRITTELPAEVVRHMHYYLGSPMAERLLTGNIWAKIGLVWPLEYKYSSDVNDWLGRCGYSGGIPLAKLQKNPPTWAEKQAAAEKVRNDEQCARIASAVGSAEPLSEAEHQLGKSLESHDWAYSYSDCGATWRRGQAHRDELELALRALPVERAQIVWTAFVHEHNEQYWKCPV